MKDCFLWGGRGRRERGIPGGERVEEKRDSMGGRTKRGTKWDSFFFFFFFFWNERREGGKREGKWGREGNGRQQKEIKGKREMGSGQSVDKLKTDGNKLKTDHKSDYFSVFFLSLFHLPLLF